MLLISESGDKSTDQVIDWLFFYCSNLEFIRTNVDCDFKKILVNIGKKQPNVTENKYEIVWNRRGHIPIIPNVLKKTIWFEYVKKEQLSVLEFFELSNDKYFIGSFQKEYHNNKLKNLQEASNVGLAIPHTVVTNNKEDLMFSIDRSKKYITKSLYHTPLVESENSIYYGNGTIEIDINNIPPVFAPSLIQEKIEKDIEVRVFFIERDVFSMAIFSQNDVNTQLDFRNYNIEKPNRLVPFKLPDEILFKVLKFIENNSYNTGSIDLILTPQNDFVFLEINPMGQYDWLSYNCNYYIDRKIAEILIRNEKENT